MKHVNIDLIEYTSAYGYRNRGPTRSEIARHLLVWVYRDRCVHCERVYDQDTCQPHSL